MPTYPENWRPNPAADCFLCRSPVSPEFWYLDGFGNTIGPCCYHLIGEKDLTGTSTNTRVEEH